MKYRANSNTKRRRDANGVSLFPFLAVLICTMGVLILLLVIITHQARLQAAQESFQKNKTEEDETARQQEDVQRRIELLKKSRRKTKKQLGEIRLRLGIIEDHSRKLAEKLSRLEATRIQLERSKADGQKRRQIEKELAETKANIARVEADIEKTRREIKQQSRSHRPVIPYEGSNGTMRIPICVECRGDAVVLQPEGIVLTEADFDGPLGPGNPLAAALRAAREHMLASMGDGLGTADIDRIEPYPLLLVRPDGTDSYNCARLAMRSWGPDFGYELIDEDWNISYGSPNPELAQAMQEAIAAARLKQVRLAAAAPRHYPKRGGASSGGRSYTASGHGGVRAYRGPLRKSRYRTPGERLAGRKAAMGGSAHGGSPTGDGNGSGSGSGRGNGFGGGNVSGNQSANGLTTGNAMAGGHGAGSGNGMGSDGTDNLLGGSGNGNSQAGGDSMLGGNGNGSGINNQANQGSGGQYGNGQYGNGQAGSGQDGTGQAGTGQDGSGQDGTGQAGTGQDGTGQAGGGQAGSGQAGANMRVNIGESETRPSHGGKVPDDTVAQPNPYRNHQQQQQGRHGVARRPGEWMPSDPRHRPTKLDQRDPDNDKKHSRHKPGSLAPSRGKNWGLPGSTPRSTPLPRPIRIECHSNRLVVVPERGLSGRQEVTLDARTSDSIDEFVSAIWYYMDNSWGIAGNRMYWKPILSVDVAPGAEGRYNDLKALLDESGLEVRRKQGPMTSNQ